MNRGLQTIFISGVCGAGKSTIAWELGRVLPPAAFSVYEFDYPGVPSDTPDTWRAERTESWLHTATVNAGSNISTIVCGLIHPDESIAAPSASVAPPIRFAFLEASDDQIASRLQERYTTPLFADLLWRQARITPEQFIPTMFSYQRDLRTRFSNPRYSTYFVDTTQASVAETGILLARWICEQPNPRLERTGRQTVRHARAARAAGRSTAGR
jgi:hypothetical protein